MISTLRWLNSSVWESSDALLGFNEPNHAPEANLFPKEAADLWPTIEAAAKMANISRIGSPSACVCGNCTYGQTFEWFDAFFSNCTNCKVTCSYTSHIFLLI